MRYDRERVDSGASQGQGGHEGREEDQRERRHAPEEVHVVRGEPTEEERARRTGPSDEEAQKKPERNDENDHIECRVKPAQERGNLGLREAESIHTQSTEADEEDDASIGGDHPLERRLPDPPGEYAAGQPWVEPAGRDYRTAEARSDGRGDCERNGTLEVPDPVEPEQTDDDVDQEKERGGAGADRDGLTEQLPREWWPPSADPGGGADGGGVVAGILGDSSHATPVHQCSRRVEPGGRIIRRQLGPLSGWANGGDSARPLLPVGPA